MSRSIAVVCAVMLVSLLVGSPVLAQGSSDEARQACKQGGWESLRRADGTGFANQGECVSYATQGNAFSDGDYAPSFSAWATAVTGESGDPGFHVTAEGSGFTAGSQVFWKIAFPDGIHGYSSGWAERTDNGAFGPWVFHAGQPGPIFWFDCAATGYPVAAVVSIGDTVQRTWVSREIAVPCTAPAPATVSHEDTTFDPGLTTYELHGTNFTPGAEVWVSMTTESGHVSGPLQTRLVEPDGTFWQGVGHPCPNDWGIWADVTISAGSDTVTLRVTYSPC